MNNRFVSIWFRYLKTDWFTCRQTDLLKKPFVLYTHQRGRMVITEANALAESKGVYSGTVLADAKASISTLQVHEEKPEYFENLLNKIAEWCIRYSPIVSIDSPDGIIIDATGCAHLWGSEENYVNDIVCRLSRLGYHVRIAMASTIGVAWALSHYGVNKSIVLRGKETEALMALPPQSLRLENMVVERLHKLGFKQIKNLIGISRSVLRRRFGDDFIKKMNYALGTEEEIISPIHVNVPHSERLNCLEPIVTLVGIEIALNKLLERLCKRLYEEQNGFRAACFKAYRVDGKIESVQIGTNRPSHDVKHLFKLFSLKLETIEPAMGIELFILEAVVVEPHLDEQEQLWKRSGGLEEGALAELLDRIENNIGINKIYRYVPAEHHWPERSFKQAISLQELPSIEWKNNTPRPVKILEKPEPILVTAPIPDYPPMLFIYKNKIHHIKKADGPERIEQEWWLQEGLHRDYYYVEDEEGQRYWLFRAGHYGEEKKVDWFLHGFCA